MLASADDTCLHGCRKGMEVCGSFSMAASGGDAASVSRSRRRHTSSASWAILLLVHATFDISCLQLLVLASCATSSGANEEVAHSSELRRVFIDRVFGGRDILRDRPVNHVLEAEKNATLPEDVLDRFSDGGWQTHLTEADLELVTYAATRAPGGKTRPIKFWLELGSFRGQSCLKTARFLKDNEEFEGDGDLWKQLAKEQQLYYKARDRVLGRRVPVQHEENQSPNDEVLKQDGDRDLSTTWRPFTQEADRDQFMVLCVDSFVFGSSFVSTLVQDLEGGPPKDDAEDQIKHEEEEADNTKILDRMLFKDGASKLLDQFILNVRHQGLQNVIAVWPQTTLSALRLLGKSPASLPTLLEDGLASTVDPPMQWVNELNRPQGNNYNINNRGKNKAARRRRDRAGNVERSPSYVASSSSRTVTASSSSAGDEIDRLSPSKANSWGLLGLSEGGADVIYLDASHLRDETLMELEHCWQVLRPGGILFGDDWSLEEVAEDVLKFVEMLNLAQLYEDDPVEWRRRNNVRVGGSTESASETMKREGGEEEGKQDMITGSGKKKLYIADQHLLQEAKPLPGPLQRLPHLRELNEADHRREKRMKLLLPENDKGFFANEEMFREKNMPWFYRRANFTKSFGKLDLNWFPHQFYRKRVAMLRPGLFVSRDTFQWFLRKGDPLEVAERRRTRYELVTPAFAPFDRTNMEFVESAEKSPAFFNPMPPALRLRTWVQGMFYESDFFDAYKSGVMPADSETNFNMKLCFMGMSTEKLSGWRRSCCQDWSEANKECWDIVYHPKHCCFPQLHNSLEYHEQLGPAQVQLTVDRIR
ncbi:unnamed protein product [Amoebophrya sp. A25]|nr:unnamed protein product [Amoebophrya sp. A25]|eukprot:GSA25T00009290001.1